MRCVQDKGTTMIHLKPFGKIQGYFIFKQIFYALEELLLTLKVEG
jgi:hypothetical protein